MKPSKPVFPNKIIEKDLVKLEEDKESHKESFSHYFGSIRGSIDEETNILRL